MASHEDFERTRRLSREIAAPLSDADASLQPMPDASPAKWHLAHTSWFFETFVLRDFVPGYRCDPDFAFLFNSYYEGEGARHPRTRRGMISRPSLDAILTWRDSVDAAMLSALPDLPSAARTLVGLGLAHEGQHQELMLMDMLATFAENPLVPAVWPRSGEGGSNGEAPAPGSLRHPGGVVSIGAGPQGGFSFDAERPAHAILLQPFELADRPVSNGEWLRFIAAGGYEQPLLWLSDGWDWRRREDVEAPLYWRRSDEGEWQRFGLDGLRPIDAAAPVCHISYYEADAFARWAGARLPREGEWEAIATGREAAGDNLLDVAGPVAPRPGGGLFGDVWEWTMSAFLPYPGFMPDAGTVGEYNGKFMVSQMVLKGGSCATPRGHVFAHSRNFFYPHQRWQFAGLRLARDA